MAIKIFIEIFVFNLNKTMTNHNHSKKTQKERTVVSSIVVPIDKCG